MKNLYILFSVINIFAIYSHAATIRSAANVFDEAVKNFSETCPVLNNNVLFNSSTKYLSNCKDISFINPPERIDIVNLNKFYCIGILVADKQLCNSLLNNDHKYLPQNISDLEFEIEKIRITKPKDICNSFTSMAIFNDVAIMPIFSKTISELKQNLIGPHCIKVCSDLQEDKTNKWCSLIYYIHVLTENITKHVAKPNVTTQASKNDTEVITSSVTKQYNESTEHRNKINKQVAANVHNKSSSVLSLNETTSLNVTNKKSSTENLLMISQSNANDLDKKINKAKNVSIDIVAKETIQQQPTKYEQSNNIPVDRTIEQSEEKPLVDNNSNLHEEILQRKEDVVLEKKPTTTTDINQQNFDNDSEEYEPDDLVDSNKSLNDEPNPIAQKVQEALNERGDTSAKNFVEVEQSNFFSYFMFISVMFIAGYVVYHNKQKILALVLEGRRERNSRRRPSTSSYRKLNSNLEEAVTSKCSGSASHVIY